MFEDVMFPMRTLYCPPVPPSMLMGRYRPPPRPGHKYRNDISLAGPLEHWAQAQVARMWRGVLTRRRLRNERNYYEVRTRRATMIQCWWRCLRAIWKRRMLHNLREEWAASRREKMVKDRLKGYDLMMAWQRKRLEDAVIKLQRVIRWYLSNRPTIGIPQIQDNNVDYAAPKRLPFPLRRRRKVYFPWRRRSNAKTNGSQSTTSSDTGKAPGTKGRSSSLQFRKERKQIFPATVEEAKVINDAMRVREEQRALTLAQPEVQDRLQWKRDGLREKDFDHNAGMIQRLAKYKWDGWKKETLKITTDYFDIKVRTIQRGFRVFQTLRRMRRAQVGVEKRSAYKNRSYANAKLELIREETAWQNKLLNCAAQTIQLMWARYKYRKQQCDPFMEAEAQEVAVEVPPPPYNLLTEHIARERTLRDVARSRMEREMEAASKAVRRLRERYVPKEILVISGDGVYFKNDATTEENSNDNEVTAM
ncbi:hypothetical protein DQ04_01721040 [Trypanosoma grayi]|uniref:hypothetical protein n=1 Tax=Trypanosoma grayi TaxID=71804 RepID=UPI0004F3F8AB|nr:hypothetical protein DQ04_01721040 [Trypanosoma grayi]KEG12429.1 hypothetical protein DQ04_01721040 [Trypanosoma grayi]